MNNIGKGLDSLSVAIVIIGFMCFIYMLFRGIAVLDLHSRYDKSYRNKNEARCASLQGFYSENKCYINGEEI